MVQALGALLALLPTYLIRFQILGFPTTLLELLVVGFLLVTLCRLKTRDLSKFQSLGAINWAIGAFVLAGMISVGASPEKARALGQLKAFIVEPVLMFYAAVWTIKNEKDLRIVLRWILSGGIVVSLYGILQYFTFLGLPSRFWGGGEETIRVVSFFEHPNQLALFLAPLLVFFAALFINRYPLTKKRWPFALGLGLLAWALILTFSRGAWLGTLVGLAAALLNKYSYKKLILPAVVVGLALLLVPAVRFRIGMGLSDASSAAHWDLMRVGWHKVLSSPLVGNGLYGFRTTLSEANFSGEIINYPHNIFLNFWLETGLLGLISFLWLLVLAFRRYKNTPALIKFAAGMFLIALVVHGLVDIPYFKNDLSVMFWFMMSLFYLNYSR